MQKLSMERSVESKLTIYFDEPFWVGVFEELDGDKLSACRMVFGAEPTDSEIYDFILKHYYHLRFSAPVKAEIKKKADNPKRRQRNARKQLETAGIGTKSQQVLQKQYEENKTERKQLSREQREAEKQRQQNTTKDVLLPLLFYTAKFLYNTLVSYHSSKPLHL